MRYVLMIALLMTLPAQAASEAQCRQAFTDWMLAQQKQFSDRKASKMERRSAERAIDQVRDEFARQESFCQAMEWVEHNQDQDPRFTPRSGEIHDFAPAS
ncbi:hypothetical protein MM182_19785 [Aeromonas sp. MR19]|uniref:hypothetical protein n=1 Tax=Aeromonas TaxID=642 RepID=UPI000BFBE360|nr:MULTISPECIES: hypothetical protein [unclassified Aeromonas]ATL98562.1 hypothetical protein CK910_08775 [Aeromonas sp. CA23]MCH7377591.1 hypothetical protein [Aeromonas sp. MR19]